MHKIQHAVRLFTGTNDTKRINCAEAISKVYHLDIAPLDEKELKSFKKCGHGKAPGKVCGAYYAGNKLLELGQPEQLDKFKTSFQNEAGTLVCREIMRDKNITCEECVAIAAQYLSKLTL